MIVGRCASGKRVDDTAKPSRFAESEWMTIRSHLASRSQMANKFLLPSALYGARDEQGPQPSKNQCVHQK